MQYREITEKPPVRSRAKFWILCLIGLPVLYVLSSGPVVGMMTSGKPPKAQQDFVQKVYQPVTWLSQSLKMEETFEAYLLWWAKVLDRP